MVLAIAAGLLAAGIISALPAVPLLAVRNGAIRSMLGEDDDRPLPTENHTSQPEESEARNHDPSLAGAHIPAGVRAAPPRTGD